MSVEDPRLSNISEENLTENFSSEIQEEIAASSTPSPIEHEIQVAQAGDGRTPTTGRVPTDQSVPAAAPAAPVAEVTPDVNNIVHLATSVSIDDIRVDGANLILVQADGTEIVIVNGAAKIPTMLIGEVEVPQQVLFAALEDSGINVAAGPDGSFSASGRPDSSGAEFDDSIQASQNDPIQLASLLGDTEFGDGGGLDDRTAADDQPDAFDMGSPFIFSEAVLADDVIGNETITGTLGFDGGDDFGIVSSVNYQSTFDMAEGTGSGVAAPLTSGGQAVTVSTSADGLTVTGTITVGETTVTVFTLTVTNPTTGAFTYTQSQPLDHPDLGQIGADDALRLNFTFTVTDKDGDSDTGSFSIEIGDDGPSINGSVTLVSVNEDDLSNGNDEGEARESLVSSADLGISWGADANVKGESEGDSFGRSIAFNSDGLPQNLTSGGVGIVYGTPTVSADGTVTITAYKGNVEGPAVFTVTLDPTSEHGTATFELKGPLDHASESDSLPLTFNYTATDADGDSHAGSFSVTIDDDIPTIGENSLVQLDDDALEGGNPEGNGDDADSVNATGVLAHAYGADGAGSVLWLSNGLTLPAGFSAAPSEGGTVMTIFQGDRAVVSITITDTATGAYKVTQLAPINHPQGTIPGTEDNVQFTVSYQATDKDGDAAATPGTLTINVDDDIPTIGENSLVQLDDDALEGGNPEGNGDDADSVNATGVLAHAYGADGAGSVLWLSNGLTLPAGFSAAPSEGGTVMTIFQGDRAVVSITITDTATGAYKVTQLAPINHPQGTIPGTEDNVQFTVSYQATDKDGDAAATPGTLTINVDDDIPIVVDNDILKLDDDTLGGNADGVGDDTPTATSGILGHSFGADVAGSISWSGSGLTLPYGFWFVRSEDGSQLTITQNQNGTYVPVFKLVIDSASTGAYHVEQLATVNHAGTNPGFEDNISVTVSYDVKDGDNDVATGTLTIDLDDDTAKIGTPFAGGIVEEEQGVVIGAGNEDTSGTGDADALFGLLDRTTQTTGGTLAISWGSDNADNETITSGAGNRSVAFGPAALANLDAQNLTSRGLELVYTLSADGTVLTAHAGTEAGSTVFTVTLSDNGSGSYSFTLIDTLDHPASGEDQIALNFQFTATDSDGDTTGPATFIVNVIDDVPTAGGVGARYVEEEALSGGNEDVSPLGVELTGAVLNGGPITDKIGASLNISWGGDDSNTVANGGFTGTQVMGDRSVVFAASGAAATVVAAADAAAFMTVKSGNTTLDLASLTSGGQALVYTLSANGTVLTAHAGSANGAAVFTVTLSDAGKGSYSFDLDGVLDHPVKASGANNEDVLTFNFTVTARDSDGDVVKNSFQVNVIDDSPVIAGPAGSGSLSEAGLPTVSFDFDSLNIKLGADNKNTHVAIGTDVHGAPIINANLTSDGVALDYVIRTTNGVDQELVAFKHGETVDNPVFIVAVLHPGSFATTLYQNLDHPAGSDNLTLNLVARVYDGDGDFVDQPFKIDVTDTIPTVGAAPAMQTVFEDGTLALSGVPLSISWGSDDANPNAGNNDRSINFAKPIAANNVTISGPAGALPNLTSNGAQVQFAFIGAYLVGFIGAIAPASATDAEHVVFNVLLSDLASGSYTFNLLQPLDHPAPVGTADYIDLAFTYHATDSDHDTTAEQTFVVRVDAAGTIDSINYSNLTSSVFVNLDDAAHTVLGQSVAGDRATDGALVADKIIGIDNVTGINDAIGGSADDILIGGDEANKLSGNGGDDYLDGGLGADNLDGGEGNDTFVLGADVTGSGTRNIQLGDGSLLAVNIAGLAGTADKVVGGAGNDTIILERDGKSGFVADYSTAPGYLSGVEKIVGTDGNDVILLAAGSTADGGPITIEGGDGNDILGGSNSADIINGGDGNDLISGLGGNDTLTGGNGDDVIWGGLGADTIHSGAGSDTIEMTADLTYAAGTLHSVPVVGLTTVGVDISGKAGTLDSINGGFDLGDTVYLKAGSEGFVLDGYQTNIEGVERIVGTDGDDVIVMRSDYVTDDGAGRTTIEGGLGNDTIVGGAGNDFLDGGQGADTLAGGDGADILKGGADNDALWGGKHADSLYGNGTTNQGADLNATAGEADVANYGAAADKYHVFFDTSVLQGGVGIWRVEALDGAPEYTGSNVNVDTDNLYGIELIEFSNGIVLDLTDPVRVFDGVNLIGTYDSIQAANDAASTLAGYRIELVGTVTGEAATITKENLTVVGGADDTGITLTLNGVQNITLDGAAPINVVGNDLSNAVEGNDGANVITSGKAGDTLNGGDGDDTFILSADLDDATGQGSRTVTLGDGSTISVSLDHLSGEGDSLNGGAGVDTVEFVSAAGAAGFVFDRANYPGTISGIERFIGTDGNDIILLPQSYTSGTDPLYMEGGAGNDVLQGSNAQADHILGGADDDLISGLGGNDTLEGGSGNDQIWGGLGADKLYGEDGNDTLVGGKGDDLLDGGTNSAVGFNRPSNPASGDAAAIIASAFGGDTADYSSLTTGVLANLGDAATWPAAIPAHSAIDSNGANDAVGTDTLVDIENLTGGIGDDILAGDGNGNILKGGAGSDTLLGGAGDDLLIGGDDNVGDGLIAGAGNDVLILGNGGGTAKGEGGDDLIYGGSSGDWLYGEDDGNPNPADAGADTIFAGGGNDHIEGGGGADKLYGEDGDDTLIGGKGDDQISGNAGNDTFVYKVGDGADVIDGGTETGSIFPDYDVLKIAGDAEDRTFTIGKSTLADLQNVAPADDRPDVLVTYSGTGGTTVRADEIEGIEITLHAGGGTVNVGDLSGTAIEPSTIVINGGTGNDTIDLTGLAGTKVVINDIDGIGGDTDSVKLAGKWADYNVTESNGTFTISLGGHVVATTTNVEQFVFTGESGGGIVTADQLLNDAPLAIADSNSVVEAGGVANGIGGIPSATGNVLTNDTDADSGNFDTKTVTSIQFSDGSVTAVAGNNNVTVAGVYGTLTIHADGSYAYALDNNDADTQGLAQNASATEVFTYVMKDSGGLTSTASLAISITGTNDAAVINGGGTGTVVEAVTNGSAGTPTASGDLNSTDVDNPNDSWTAVNTATASINGYGTYTIDASGHWTYALDNANPTVNALNTGSQLTDTFTVTTVDGTAKEVTVTITGTTDSQPVSVSEQASPTGRYAFTDNFDSPHDINFATSTLFSGGTGTISYTYALVLATDTDDWLHTGSTVSGNPYDGDVFDWDGDSGLYAYRITATDSLGSTQTSYVAFSAIEYWGTTINITANDNGQGQTFMRGWANSNNDDGDLILLANIGIVGQVYAGGGHDVVIGGGDANLIDGGSGDDAIYGMGGNDVLSGGTGTDFIDGGDGNDTIAGGDGNDVLLGGSGNDTFNYAIGDGADIIVGGTGSDTIAITGGSAPDSLTVLLSGGVVSQFNGVTVSGVESITANLDGGTDTLSYAGTTEAVNVNLANGSASGFSSISGVDNVTGGSGNDILVGDGNANILVGGNGADTLSGGGGDDTLYGAGDDIFLDGGAGANSLMVADGFTDASLGNSGIINIQKVTLVSAGILNLSNQTEDLIITGSSGNDTITSGSGNDTITGGGGTNSFVGGGGSDTLLVAGGYTGSSDIQIQTIEKVTLTSSGVLNLTNQTEDLIITGSGGADTITGGSGDDTITGGGGTDTFTGGGGNDTLLVAGGFTSSSNNQIQTIEMVTLTSAGVLNLSNQSEGLIITGSTGNDTITGSGGNDTITGGSGDDTITGGGGTDNFIGGDGTDTLLVAGGYTGSSDIQIQTIEKVTLTSSGVLNLTNQTEDLIITGSSGADTITGGSGDDTIIGSGSSDTLRGGLGSDAFVFNGNESGNDTIKDFTSVDSLKFQNFSLANQPTGALTNVVTVTTVGGNSTSGSQSIADADLVVFNVTPSSANSATEIATLLDNQRGTFNGGVFVLAYDSNNKVALYYSSDANGGSVGDVKLVAVFDSLTSVTDSNAPKLASQYSMLSSAVDPIILDLDRNGFAFTSLEDGVKFDIDADGHKDQVAWTKTDGILAFDVDGNGKIDNGSEIFTPNFAGGAHAGGVAALSTLDVNHDGKIDASDTGFDKLLVWQDANGNGVSDEGELKGLNDYGITGISLDAESAEGYIDGQSLFAEGSFTYADGSTGSFVEVGFDTIFSDAPDHVLVGTDGDDILAGMPGLTQMTGGAGADTFVLDPSALHELDMADIITDYKSNEGDAVDVSKLLDTLLGHQATGEEAAANVRTTIAGNDTTVSVQVATDSWKDVAVLQNHTEAVKILFDDDKHSANISHV
jgi:T1SS-143 domain-containing protein